MATHSSVLAWRIPGTGEPGGLLSLGSHRVGHDWSDLAVAVLVGSYIYTTVSFYDLLFLFSSSFIILWPATLDQGCPLTLSCISLVFLTYLHTSFCLIFALLSDQELLNILGTVPEVTKGSGIIITPLRRHDIKDFYIVWVSAFDIFWSNFLLNEMI